MSTQKIATSTNGTLGKGFKFAAATAAVIIMMVFAAGTAVAGSPSNTTPQNVDVVNTPTVNVGNTPNVTVANTPSVNVANTPAVSISGTPNVNVQFPANQAVTVTPGSSTNVGRLPSDQVTLVSPFQGCPSHILQVGTDGSGSCFDMANHPGQVLVITDIFWEGQVAAGNTCLANLESPLGKILFIFSAVGAADGYATKSEHMTTGLKMTVNATPLADNGCSNPIFWTQGYLLTNQ